MKHILKRTAIAAVIISILFSVCSPAKRTYDFSKTNCKASVWLFANDDDPTPKKHA